MIPWKAVMRALLLAPLPVWAVVGFLGIFSDLSIPHWTIWEAVGHELFVFPYYVVGSYFFCFAIALPLYVWGWRHFKVSLLSCLLCGGIIGGGPSLVISLLQIFGLWATWQDENSGGVPLIVANKFTRAGIIHYLLSGVPFAVAGAACAFTFWLFAIRKNPAAQSRRQALDVGE